MIVRYLSISLFLFSAYISAAQELRAFGIIAGENLNPSDESRLQARTTLGLHQGLIYRQRFNAGTRLDKKAFLYIEIQPSHIGKSVAIDLYGKSYSITRHEAMLPVYIVAKTHDRFSGLRKDLHLVGRMGLGFGYTFPSAAFGHIAPDGIELIEHNEQKRLNIYLTGGLACETNRGGYVLGLSLLFNIGFMNTFHSEFINHAGQVTGEVSSAGTYFTLSCYALLPRWEMKNRQKNNFPLDYTRPYKY